MEKYLNRYSGIDSYEIGDDFVRVIFHDKTIYLYTESSAGEENINQMKILARRGYGLNTFINQHVRKKYARKER
jgi:hypothetical protein